MHDGTGNVDFVLTREACEEKLRLFVRGSLSATEVSDWANSMEENDHVLLEAGFEKLIADVLFQVSTPEINRPLSLEVAIELIAQLSGENAT